MEKLQLDNRLISSLYYFAATELSVVEATFKISQGGGSGVVDELRDALVDTYA